MALFKKAAPKSAVAKSGAPVLVASDLADANGTVLYTKDQVVDAIKGFAEGKQLQQQGESLQETHKPVLAEFARRGFCREWAQAGVRPKSPKITTTQDGTGTFITMSFIDKPVLINDQQLEEIKTLVGPANADQMIEKFTQYSIDAKIAGQTVTIKGKTATFQEHIEEALVSYFPEEHHETIAAMLKPKEVQQTRKGVIDRLLDFVGRGKPSTAVDLAELLLKSRCITAYKPGAVGSDD